MSIRWPLVLCSYVYEFQFIFYTYINKFAIIAKRFRKKKKTKRTTENNNFIQN